MIHTEETKKKLSEMRTGSKNPFYGKHHTDEVKKMLSERRRIQNEKRQYDISEQKITVPDGLNLAYLSGFCDADGSIRFIKNNGKPRPFIAFYNTNIEVIKWINLILSHGSVQYHNQGREQVQAIRIDGARDVYALAIAMLPFLIVKKEDAIAVINFLEQKYGDRIKGGS